MCDKEIGCNSNIELPKQISHCATDSSHPMITCMVTIYGNMNLSGAHSFGSNSAAMRGGCHHQTCGIIAMPFFVC